MAQAQYFIGIQGQVWQTKEKQQWLTHQVIKRSYFELVVPKITALKGDFDVVQYGELDYSTAKYPLMIIKSRDWDDAKPTLLVTGGVHGYETSGVFGAIAFAKTKALAYVEQFNIIVAPCVSPWGFETINRWNPQAIDPNRSFYPDSPAPESAALMDYVKGLDIKIKIHVDLHETTDTDNSEFRPALAARDAQTHDNWNIADGFYLVGDTTLPRHEFQKSIIKQVAAITHIAPADDNGKLIGVVMEQTGVINYDTKGLGLCAGFSDSDYCTTTEVYPDSPLVNQQNCVDAQVAAITGALDYF